MNNEWIVNNNNNVQAWNRYTKRIIFAIGSTDDRKVRKLMEFTMIDQKI